MYIIVIGSGNIGVGLYCQANGHRCWSLPLTNGILTNLNRIPPATMPVRAVIEREAQMNSSMRSVSSSIAGAHDGSPAFSAATRDWLNAAVAMHTSPSCEMW